VSAVSVSKTPATGYAELSTQELVEKLREWRKIALDAIRNRRHYSDPDQMRASALAEVEVIRTVLDGRGIDPMPVPS